MRPIGRWRKIVPLMKCVAQPPRGRVALPDLQRSDPTIPPQLRNNEGGDWSKLHQSCQPPDCSEPFDTAALAATNCLSVAHSSQTPNTAVALPFFRPPAPPNKRAIEQTGSATSQPDTQICMFLHLTNLKEHDNGSLSNALIGIRVVLINIHTFGMITTQAIIPFTTFASFHFISSHIWHVY